MGTRYGDREVAEVYVDGDEVTLWGDWAETAELVDEGFDVAFYDLDGDRSTTADSQVVVEPSYMVDVTAVRSWVQCPRIQYLGKIRPTPMEYPVVKGTLVHQVFEDLLRGADVDASVERRVRESGAEVELSGESIEDALKDVRQHADAISGWLNQDSLGEDGWRSEVTLVSTDLGLKGRCDALRRGRPVELKTGKSVGSDPYFQDKIQVALYALLLRERGVYPETGTVIYTKNASLDRSEGDVSPAKDFTVGDGLLDFALRKRNEVAAYERRIEVPTGYEAEADCSRCFERDPCMVVAGRLQQESKAGEIGEAVENHELEFFNESYRSIEERRREVYGEFAELADGGRSSEYSITDVEVERVEEDGEGFVLHCRKPPDASKIREGDVVLASDGDPLRGEMARVKQLTPEEIVVSISEDIRVSRFDVYPSEFGFSRELSALHDFVLTGERRRKDVFFGEREPEFRDVDVGSIDGNPSQTDAVRRGLAADDLCLIQGPPGTGKTYTIARLVAASVDRGERVLLSSYTNRAVDNAVENLLKISDANLVRVGTEGGVGDSVSHLMLDGDDGADALRDADVVAATTSSCSGRLMRELEFDRVVLDEASQLTSTAAFAAMNRAPRWVFVGDQMQLPPVAPEESVFERLLELHPDSAVSLDKQYRMAQRIQAFSAGEFYDGTVYPANHEVAAKTLDDLSNVDVDKLEDPLRDTVCFVDVESSPQGNVHMEEVEKTAEVVETLLDAGVEGDDVGVITPFRVQAAEISERVPDDVAVDTVDRFQGSSKEAIVVSLAASGEMESPVFEDDRRLNVALTRAKRKLVLVGDVSALRSRGLYSRMVDWARADDTTPE